MTEQGRYPVSARFIGVMHRDVSTVKMFMMSILWTDENELIIYRSFDDFKKFHAQLKKKFPLENIFKRHERLLPKFRAGALLSSLQKKGSPSKSMHRLKFLDSYCIELLNSDATVTQSSEVCDFFVPQDHDLEPDFAKYSTMILAPDELTAVSGAGVVQEPVVGNVTSPFMTQTYRCVAGLDTKDTKNRDFRATADECLDVLIKDPSGWWLVENENKQLAWFPAPYLELSEPDGDFEEELEGELESTLYCAARSFSSKKADEISIPIGSVVEVLKKSDDGWWMIKYSGRTGYVPLMYLQPYNPRAGMNTLAQRKMPNSIFNLAAQSPAMSRSGQMSPRAARSSPFRTPPLQSAHSLDVLGAKKAASDLSSSSESLERKRSPSSSSSSSSSSPPGGSDGGYSSPDVSFTSLFSPISPSTAAPTLFLRPPSGSGPSSDPLASPRVPPRPNPGEILSRCSTLTRKAANDAKVRIVPESDLMQV